MSTLLSNLRVRPNLLAEATCQRDMLRCSVFELRDIKRRNDNLISQDAFPLDKQREWRDSLFWGQDPPPPLDRRWPEHLAAGLEDLVRAVEERPSLEDAVEALLVARLLYDTRTDGPAREQAADWDRRLCRVLARDEFRFTLDMVAQKLETVLGRPLAAPKPAVMRSPLAPATAPVEPTSPKPPVAAVVSPPTGPDAGIVPPPAAPPAAAAEAAPDGIRHAVAVAKPRSPRTITDPDLIRVARRWDRLPDHVKQCILMLVDAAQTTAEAAKE